MNGMDIILYEYVFAKRNQFKMWSPYEFSNCGVGLKPVINWLQDQRLSFHGYRGNLEKW